MPKMKTNRAAAKRFRRSKNGGFKRSNAGARHIMTKKTAKRKRGLRKADVLDKAEQARVERMLPYA